MPPQRHNILNLWGGDPHTALRDPPGFEQPLSHVVRTLPYLALVKWP